MKNIEENIHKWKDILYLWIGEQFVNMTIQLKAICT